MHIGRGTRVLRQTMLAVCIHTMSAVAKYDHVAPCL